MKFNPRQLLKGRGLIWTIVAVVAVGGGYYLFTDRTPQRAVATTFKKKTDDAVANTPTARRDVAANTKAKPLPATNPAPKSPAARTTSSTPRPPATKPAQQRAPQPSDPLGPVFTDAVHGFQMRFPAGWAIRSFPGNPWVLDAGGVQAGLISIGFSPCPPEITADKLLPEAIARRIKRRPNTTLHGQGRCVLAGRQALWSKSTGPLPMTNADPMMTRVHYILPLGDGRVLEVRVAAPPERFDATAAVMKRALDTLQIIQQQSNTATASTSP